MMPPTHNLTHINYVYRHAHQALVGGCLAWLYQPTEEWLCTSLWLQRTGWSLSPTSDSHAGKSHTLKYVRARGMDKSGIVESCKLEEEDMWWHDISSHL